MRVVVLIAAVCALRTTALADATKADELARAADELVNTSRFTEAAEKYREAYAADPKVDYICNAGIAYHKAQDLPRAQLFLSHCLKRATALEAKFVAAVRGVLATVEGALKAGDFTPVDIVVDPEATAVTIAAFGHEPSAIGPHLVWLPFGKHQLTFRAEGYLDQSLEITTEHHETLPLSVKLDKKPEPQPIVVEKPVRIARHKRTMWPAIGASAFTIGATVFAVIAFQRAHDRADIAAFALEASTYDDDKDYIQKWNTRLAISGAFAVIGAAASGFLWYRALTPTTKVEVTPTASGATVTFRTRF